VLSFHCNGRCSSRASDENSINNDDPSSGERVVFRFFQILRPGSWMRIKPRIRLQVAGGRGV
jgi:hypothetical protein